MQNTHLNWYEISNVPQSVIRLFDKNGKNVNADLCWQKHQEFYVTLFNLTEPKTPFYSNSKSIFAYLAKK